MGSLEGVRSPFTPHLSVSYILHVSESVGGQSETRMRSIIIAQLVFLISCTWATRPAEEEGRIVDVSTGLRSDVIKGVSHLADCFDQARWCTQSPEMTSLVEIEPPYITLIGTPHGNHMLMESHERMHDDTYPMSLPRSMG